MRAKTQLSRGAFFYLPLLPQNSITDLATKRQSLGSTDAETCPLGLCLSNQIDLEAGVFAFPAPERDNPKMEIYRFRVRKGWYAYELLEDAQAARQYFLDSGHPVAAVGDIEKSQDNQGFEFKMNAIEEKRAWLGWTIKPD